MTTRSFPYPTRLGFLTQGAGHVAGGAIAGCRRGECRHAVDLFRQSLYFSPLRESLRLSSTAEGTFATAIRRDLGEAGRDAVC